MTKTLNKGLSTKLQIKSKQWLESIPFFHDLFFFLNILKPVHVRIW